jgi:hypothetical protein
MTPPGTPGWVATTVAPWPSGPEAEEQEVNASTATSAGDISKQTNTVLFIVLVSLVVVIMVNLFVLEQSIISGTGT